MEKVISRKTTRNVAQTMEKEEHNGNVCITGFTAADFTKGGQKQLRWSVSLSIRNAFQKIANSSKFQLIPVNSS